MSCAVTLRKTNKPSLIEEPYGDVKNISSSDVMIFFLCSKVQCGKFSLISAIACHE
jgi:hypothetical protein